MVTTTDLESYWKLDETSGTTATDSHGSNDGTASNSRVFTAATSGILNTCADFTQGDDEIACGAITTPNLGVSCWVKLDSTPASAGYLIGNRKEVAANGHWNIRQFNGIIYFELRDGGTTSLINNGASIGTSDFVHVVATYDGTSQKLFINGVLKAIATTLSGDLTTNTNTVYMGNRESRSDYLDGDLDEVGIWSRNLTDGGVTTVDDTAGGEVAELYNSGDGLAYPFTAGPATIDEADTTTLSDSLAFTKKLKRLLSDTTTISDSLTISRSKKIYLKEFADTTNISDVLSLQTKLKRIFNDNTTLSDSLSINIAKKIIVKQFLDTTNLSDSLLFKSNLYRKFLDITNISDTLDIVAIRRPRTVSISDTTTLSDSLTISRSPKVNMLSLSDNFSLSDILTTTGGQIVIIRSAVRILRSDKQIFELRSNTNARK